MPPLVARHPDARPGPCSASRSQPVGTPLYTDVRLYVEGGIAGVIYGAGPRTVLECNAKRADAQNPKTPIHIFKILK